MCGVRVRLNFSSDPPPASVATLRVSESTSVIYKPCPPGRPASKVAPRSPGAGAHTSHEPSPGLIFCFSGLVRLYSATIIPVLVLDLLARHAAVAEYRNSGNSGLPGFETGFSACLRWYPSPAPCVSFLSVSGKCFLFLFFYNNCIKIR